SICDRKAGRLLPPEHEAVNRHRCHLKDLRASILPSNGASVRLAPPVLRNHPLDALGRMLLPQPSKDGPPHVVVKPVKHLIGSPRVFVEDTPTTQHRIEPLEAGLQSSLDRSAPEQVLDTFSKALAPVLRDHDRAHEPPVIGVGSHADVMSEKPQRTRNSRYER